jgi:hypothetical protein
MFRYRGQFKDASLYTLANVSVALRGDGTGCLGMGEPCSAHWHVQLNTSSKTSTVASIVDCFEESHHVYYVVGLHDETLCYRGDTDKLLREGRGMRRVRGNGFRMAQDLEHSARSECNHPRNGSKDRLSIL